MKTSSLNLNGIHIATVLSQRHQTNEHILFVHGGPGNHSAFFQKFVEEETAYQQSPFNWLFYDQRGCGRSDKISNLDTLSHERNIQDLSDILDQFSDSDNDKIRAIFGHSYGAWLAYDTLLVRKDLSNIKLIMAGRSVDKLLSRSRLVSIDLLILKMYQKDDFDEVIAKISASHEPFWTHAEYVRSKLKDLSKRKEFYWANSTMRARYEEIMSRINIPENNDIFWQVRKSLYGNNPTGFFDPRLLAQEVMWINGVHDYIMGGETVFPEQSDYIVTFNGSAHYPHIEEAEKFISETTKFIFREK